jgi:alkylation response protein AidB-like acyl-CoA dehydrogenase
MNFAFSEEQEAFRDGVRRFCAERWSLAEVRRMLDTPLGFERTVWKQMAGELGLQGLLVPEALGGQGAGFLELGLALEVLGRELAGGPFLASLCATLAILEAGSESDRREWLPALAAGDAVAALARVAGPDRDGAEGLPFEARPAGAAFLLRGGPELVLDAPAADLLVVPARRPGARGVEAVSLFVARADGPGVRIAACEPLDLTRRLGELTLEDAPGRPLGAEGEGGAALARTLDLAAVALAAEMVGGAARCLELAVEHAKTRIQFGRPIGSFQAIQHKAAEVLLEVESARAAAWWACWVAEERDTQDLPLAASLAKAAAADAYRRAAAECLQIHGGIGFTFEHDAHLFFRRAHASDALFGDAAVHRARLADRLLGSAR